MEGSCVFFGGVGRLLCSPHPNSLENEITGFQGSIDVEFGSLDINIHLLALSHTHTEAMHVSMCMSITIF